MACCMCFGPGRKMNLKDNSDKKSKRDKSSSSSSAKPAARAAPSSETVQDSEYKCQIFSYRELATATKNFRDECLIGRGGFGTVYKGRLGNGQQIAVKMLDNSGGQGDKEFLVEVLMLSLLHHENLVHLIGYCAEGDQRLLVYEYMPLGSVEDHIGKNKNTTRQTRKSIGRRFVKDYMLQSVLFLCVLSNLNDGQEALDWSTRMKIARGAAKGLQYLHNQVEPPVIYRDLKASNILLDHEYKPKLSDFGLAKFGPTEDMSHVSTRVMGTQGYCAPEYANSGKLTMKSDIYSFGVVLLELISGRKALMPSSDCVGVQSRFLVHWAQSLLSSGQGKQIVDPKLTIKSGLSKKVMERTLEVAFRCLLQDANGRPSISEVVRSLDYIVDYTSRRRNVWHERGRDMERSGTSRSPNETTRMLNVNNEEEESDPLERKRVVDEAMSWASNWRQGSQPPTPSP